MYAIDLGKLDGVKQIFHRELKDWLGSEEGSSEDEEGEDEGSSEEEEVDAVSIAPATPSTPSVFTPVASSVATADTEVEEELQAPAEVDNKPHPRPFENLRDFYARTSIEWQDFMMRDLRGRDLVVEDTTIKELKKKGFEKAEEKWWDVREEIMAMEDEQEQAGIGEVVNLEAQKSTGISRRR